MAAAAAPFSVARAQTVAPQARVLQTDDNTGVPVPLQNKKGFSLMADPEDLAFSGMKMTGGMGTFFPNVGPCPYYFTFNSETCFLTQDRAGTFQQPFFEITMLAGAPISEYRKIRNVNPGITNMKAPLGYSAEYTFRLASPQSFRWGPADGQFGNLFSGVTATPSTDATCRNQTDNLNGRVPSGYTLLAGSDCPETWSRNGFQGLRPVIQAERVRAFQAAPNAFHFNDLDLPGTAFDSSSFLGNFSTYGAISDYYREVRQRFGSVVKGGTGLPSERGYPLGLDVRFDAFQFSRPSLRNVAFWQLTITNNSAAVYGTGVDYDSLYFGVAPGVLYSSTTAQGGAAYQDFRRNALIMSRGNASRRCSATYPRRVTGITGGCAQGTDVNTLPFNSIVLLKSPLGDIQNKLLTTAGSPFFNPTSPFADDTITWNHFRRNGFGASYNATFALNDKALFGYMASIEDAFLDGRTIASFTPGQVFTFFQNENFNSNVTADLLRFNRFVPGSTVGYGKWDYNNDGIQDTIFVPGCGIRGCSANYADTIAGGLQNVIGNVGNIMSLGPFKLKAGAKTQMLYAYVGTPDSASMEAALNAVNTSYLNNFAGPAAFPAPQFTAADVAVTPAAVRDSTSGTQTALVRINIRQTPPFEDKFVRDVLNQLTSTTDARAIRLRALNPGLVGAVTARLRTNFAQLLIFKSCDNGNTFTVSTDCTAARTTNVNGQPVGFGFQPYATINVDTATGLLASTAFTDVVLPGRTYLYSFVTRTRGLADLRIIDSVGTGLGVTTLAAAFNVDADTIVSPLFRNGPTTVTVYAPISAPSGTVFGALDTSTFTGRATQRLSGTALSTLTAGSYRTFFANRFIVQQDVDTVRNVTTTTVNAQRTLSAAAFSPTDTVRNNFVADTAVFSGTGPVTIDPSYTPTRRSRSGSVVTYIDTLGVTSGTLGFVLAQTGFGRNQPLFVSRNLGSITTSGFATANNFPGFFVTPVSEAVPRLLVTIRAPGDTLNATVVSNNGVTLLNGSTALRATATGTFQPGGRYAVEWAGDAFGPGVPFLLAPSSTLQPQIQASLLARPVVTVGDTTAATKALISTTSTRPLVAAKFPFRIVTPDGTPATLAMYRRNAGTADSLLRNSILLGTQGDTTRVVVPADVWVPGDSIFVIQRSLRDSTVTVAGQTVIIVKRDSVFANGDTARGAPIQVQRTFLGAQFTLGCNGTTTPATFPSRTTCNPIALSTRGATGYLPYGSGYVTVADFSRNFDLFSEIRLNAAPQANLVRALNSTERNRILVVPNPYVVNSTYDAIDAARTATPRIKFTNVPSQGTLRIYSVSGQFVQQIDYTEADLTTGTANTLTGDLNYNLRTREGLELASGLYLYVLTPKGSNVGSKPVRGKFVIIR